MAMACPQAQDYVPRGYYCLTLVDMRDEKEKQIFKAVEGDDVEILKQILKNSNFCRLGSKNIPILSMAVLKGAGDVVKFLIDNGCDSEESDKYENTALHLLLSVDGVDKSKKKIVDILLASCSNVVEAVFANRNRRGMTPFLLACSTGCDEVLMRFLSVLKNNSIPIDKFIGSRGDNCFHYRLDSLTCCSSSTTIRTVQAMIDKIPCSAQLIDAKNDENMTPLQSFLYDTDFRRTATIAKIFLQRGASSDGVLECAISEKNEPLMEVALRAGCSHYIFENVSTLFFILKYSRFLNSELIRVIELLLAFGYDLQKEPYLYSIDELPIEYASPEYDDRRDTSKMNPIILEALRELRRSNKLLSLQRQCRNTIRRQLKGRADDVIRNLTCIPDKIKSFLLVENEQPLLQMHIGMAFLKLIENE